MPKKRIMVDMSATLLHHGHIRLLKKAAELGSVVVALVTDEEVKNTKGYIPELDFASRKEIVESIRYVDEVIAAPWLIDNAFLQEHNCDFLVHGDDNRNDIPKEKLVILPRTQGIDSSGMRERVLNSLISLNLSDKPNNSSEVIARLLIETIKREFRLE